MSRAVRERRGRGLADPAAKLDASHRRVDFRSGRSGANMPSAARWLERSDRNSAHDENDRQDPTAQRDARIRNVIDCSIQHLAGTDANPGAYHDGLIYQVHHILDARTVPTGLTPGFRPLPWSTDPAIGESVKIIDTGWQGRTPKQDRWRAQASRPESSPRSPFAAARRRAWRNDARRVRHSVSRYLIECCNVRR